MIQFEYQSARGKLNSFNNAPGAFMDAICKEVMTTT